MAQDEDLASLPSIDIENLPPLRMAESGYNGLKVISGVIAEECQHDLRWPYCAVTYKKMLKDGTIAPAVDYVQNFISGVKWRVEAPKGYEGKLKDEVALIRSIMSDMEHSWLSFIKQASSFVPFGFAPIEIVPRYRLKSKGSKYNDGLIGIKKLALRSQDTITAAEYRNKGRDFVGFWQRVNIPSNKGEIRDYVDITTGKTYKEQLIRKEKLLIFRNNPLKDSPYGVSPLNSIYEAWKYKKAYEQNEAEGVNILSALK